MTTAEKVWRALDPTAPGPLVHLGCRKHPYVGLCGSPTRSHLRPAGSAECKVCLILAEQGCRCVVCG